jgi:hypothetical protein
MPTYRAATLACLLILRAACLSGAEDGPTAGAMGQGSAAQLPAPARGTDTGDPYLLFAEPLQFTGTWVRQRKDLAADAAWQVTESELGILQRSLVNALAGAFGGGGELQLVDRREQAKLLVSTSIVAISPETGSISARLRVIRREGGTVVINAAEVRAVSDIRAFRVVAAEDPVIEGLFRAWGESLRRGLSYLKSNEVTPWS